MRLAGPCRSVGSSYARLQVGVPSHSTRRSRPIESADRGVCELVSGSGSAGSAISAASRVWSISAHIPVTWLRCVALGFRTCIPSIPADGTKVLWRAPGHGLYAARHDHDPTPTAVHLCRRSQGHRAGRLDLWHAARLHRDPDRHVHARVQSRQGPCSDQPVRSLSGVSRRVEPDRGRLQRRYALLAGERGPVEGTDGPLGAGHGEAVLGDADHRRVEQRAACSGFTHGRQQGRSLRHRRPDVEGHAACGRDRTAGADEPGAHWRAHVYRRT